MVQPREVQVPVVQFVAPSDTGKTTVVEILIGQLRARGFRVAAVKHTDHRIDIDRKGSDSWRFTEAGADVTVVASPGMTASIRRHASPPDLEEIIHRYSEGADIVLIEGFKKGPFPKIEVHRGSVSDRLLSRGDRHDPTLIAVVSDSMMDVDVPVIPLGGTEDLCRFILERFLDPR